MPEAVSGRIERTGEVYHTSILADLLTPVSAYRRIGSPTANGFLLESVEGGEKIGRYSFIGVDPYDHFEGSLADFRRRFPRPQAVAPGLPPFTGGAVALFNYELVRELENLPGPAPTHAPVVADFYSTVLAFDHLKHQIVILSHHSAQAVESVVEKLSRPESQSQALAAGSAPVKPEVQSSFTRADYCRAVEQAKEYIRQGDIFQVVLSQRFELPFFGDPFNVYRALRYINPSPYLFFLKVGAMTVTGSSPEMLLKVEGEELFYRPIAGTRRRGRDATEDLRLQQELMEDEKELAEHLMLVDLGRNDLGRVSRFGSVQVERLMFLEKYSHVTHLVSALRGKLRTDLDRFDALAACFPAGTVTGAPKVRAMEIIQQLEPSPRGIYAGAIGYLDFSGNLDSCIAIRTIILNNGKARLQAGAGVVADSVPELEFKECRNKARVLFQALEMAEGLR